jgi:hypothetical protein
MSEQPERSFKAVSWPGTGGGAGNAAVAVSAPVGAVSRKDRERAARTALEPDGPGVALLSQTPGSVLLQRRTEDGGWETLSTEPASRQGRTPITLPQDSSSRTFRVVFSPKNPNLTSWVSEPFDR